MVNIIAEIGTSHEGSADKAKQLIDAAADSGADTIKFQWVYADEILHPNTGFVKLPTGNIPLYERFRQLECTKSFYVEMMNYVHSKGCKFCCSPFGERSMKELLEINPDFIKVASPELNHYKMLKVLADYRSTQPEGKKILVIISSGVSKLCDIEKAIEILGTENVSLLHCVTSYPAPEEDYNLRVITNLKSIFGVQTGVSDHSLNPIVVPCLSVICGGTFIEKHITLSRQTEGLDDPVALEPEQFALMVHTVHQTEATLRHYGQEIGFERTVNQLSEQFTEEKIQAVLGDGVKKLAAAEAGNYERTNRSLHFMRSMKAGQILTENDVGILRTEKVLSVGVGPEFYDLLIGRKLTRDVNDGDGVSLEDFLL